MNKKKLTINTLAFGNLKHRKKQYSIMIIGIVLAMVFSSSILFLLSSLSSSIKYMTDEYYGKARFIWQNISEETLDAAKEQNFFSEVGKAHIIASAFTDEKEDYNAVPIAWLDDTAKDLYNVALTAGEYPKNENEIAAESQVLALLGINAKPGDTITLKVKKQNGSDTDENFIEKKYKLTGILKNKRKHFSMIGNIAYLPGLIVPDNTNVDLGGKEAITVYTKLINNSKSTRTGLRHFLQKYDDVNNRIWYSDTEYIHSSFNSVDITTPLIFVIIISAILMIVSCIAIINSFGANLKERKKQIGMLRAIGTTKRQIIQIFGREAFIISMIAAPVSVAISYFVTLGIIKLLGEEFVFIPNFAVLLACAAVSIVCIMLAALIPLVSASKISPIQAIRNIDATRRMNKKHIKSKKQFSVPSLIAKRSISFSRGKQAAVSIILAVAIIISGYAFSWWSRNIKNLYSISSDYGLYLYSSSSGSFINFDSYNNGYNESIKQALLSNQYVDNVTGEKTANVNVLTQFTNSDYRKYLSENYVDPCENFKSYQEEVEFSSKITKENFADYYLKQLNETYLEKQAATGYGEFIEMEIVGLDKEELEQLNTDVYDGKIDIDKLNSGKEIILCAPKRIGVLFDEKYGGRITGRNDSVNPKECVFTADCDFKAGEKLTLSILRAKEFSEDSYYEIAKSCERKDTDVKIGALISGDNGTYGNSISELCVITSIQGLETMISGIKYSGLSVNLNQPCTDEIDKELLDIISSLTEGVEEASYISNYQSLKDQKSSVNNYFIIFSAIAILFYAICLSMINNSITSSIREDKTKIGTLRAVGASERELVGSYIRQLLSMLLWGTALGFGAYLVSYIFFFIKMIVTGSQQNIMAINPLLAIMFTAIVFVVCSLNLWAKIRKEMKNSIVENIREL